ncbi:MAG: 23S rRNA (cytosine(1962)-C(5))-methyltransferase RlmI [Acidobacteria bacterium]|nr:MAG: 23S rRNA (cytosine(1962)-C(5))-methyltransferase RlmI [Acidobacteriota bacterium]
MNDAFERRRTLTLKRGKERVIANRHPWIFAGAIHSERGPEDAAIGDLVDSDGKRLACGFYSRSSQIRLRALMFGEEDITRELIATRIAEAIARRRFIFDDTTNAARIINAEGDELSGLVVDRYNGLLVVEIANRGVEQLKPLIVHALHVATAVLSGRGAAEGSGTHTIWFKNDLPVRALEQLPTENEPVEATTIVESGLHFRIDPGEGQKTGFFLDQRENRRLARTLAGGKRVLNLFSYTGAFGVYAAAGGAAAVTNVDVSARAIELARENHALNERQAEFVVADAFQYVRQKRERFEFIVCDPPAFAKSRSDVDRAARGYKDINLHAMKLVEPGGMLMTFSCSGHMSLDLFQKVIFAAALDAGRRVSFVRRLTAAPDHPVSMYCPEGEYLKGFLLEVR